ncbi:flavodoxin family protein [Roseivirga sp. BDSF3-8]|uniref:flavodoxin family protein n=1 Tax=Roseivirga sp. BDSF3-8 TaxID=3241598 RepID=UPI00353232F1
MTGNLIYGLIKKKYKPSNSQLIVSLNHKNVILRKKPLVIVGSHRKESDTLTFTEEVMKGIPHKLINLKDRKISAYCYSGKYSEDDDFEKIASLMAVHNPIVFATPVYWYTMSGLMKDYFDRITDLLTINKTGGRRLRGKTMFVISVGSDKKCPDGFEMPFRNTATYLGMRFGGIAYQSTKRKNIKDFEIIRRRLIRHTYI